MADEAEGGGMAGKKQGTFISDLQKEFAGYNGGKLAKDIVAGLTVAAVALPLALAFAVSCGADDASGIITAIFSGLIIGALGGASFQISGPTGTMAGVLLIVVANHGHEGVLIVTFLAGIIRILAGVLKVGALVSYIPIPVVTGFTAGVAIIIATGQINSFFGTVSEGVTILERLFSYTRLGFNIDWLSVLFGGFVIALMLLWPKKLNERLPSTLLALIVTMIAQIILDLPVAEVGHIPRSIIGEQRLNLFALPWKDLGVYISPSISIAALGMVESLLCGTYAEKMKAEKFHATRELYAQGIGNMIIPLFGGIPATAAIARTSVAIRAGQQTRLTSIFHSVALIASVFFLAPFLSRVPLAALAGVLLVTAWRMNDWKSIKQIFSKRMKTSIAQFSITLVATVVFDLTTAILLGIGFSIVMFVIKSNKIMIEIDPVTNRLGKKAKPTKVVYVDGALFFGSQDKLTESIAPLIESGVKRILLSLRGVPNIDHSSITELAEIVRLARKKEVELLFCGVQPRVESMLRRLDFYSLLPEERFYPSVVVALETIAKEV
ncbi:MAG TPA: SulP family inorganic anion transporter [Sphaerochaeta sp.]|nr:SulP family inorganic anion transporter [Sphaerochaeta sp.]